MSAKLTLQMLKDLKPGIFAVGQTFDSPAGCNMANTGRIIKWVAVRGDYHDWAIYAENPYNPQDTFEEVAQLGDKVQIKKYIRRLIECDDKALGMYRH